MRHIEDRDLGIDTMGYDQPPDEEEEEIDYEEEEVDYDEKDELLKTIFDCLYERI